MSSMVPMIVTPRIFIPWTLGLSSTMATGLKPPSRGDCMASMVRLPGVAGAHDDGPLSRAHDCPGGRSARR